MLFSSLEFILFIVPVLAIYWMIPSQWQVAHLLVCSYLFYAAWNPMFLPLMILSSLIDYSCGMRLSALSERGKRKRWLYLSITTNLTILGVFKYYNFFADSAFQLLKWFGFTIHVGHLDVILPLGISFYTFQSMSYTIDVYRGVQKPEPSFTKFALYVAFFPQLIAGPIVRAKDFLYQLRDKHRRGTNRLQSGFLLFLRGAFKKKIVADWLALTVVDPVFATPADFGATTLILGALAYTAQVYYDFSGYTDMARGCARAMGFELPINFNLPYFAVGISDFWRRWHISLSTWLKDYLYIPLGGSRRGNVYVNLLITMLLGGLWHGAAWHFIWWGGYYGLLLGIERCLCRNRVTVSIPTHVKQLITFGLIVHGWVLFRSPDISTYLSYLMSIINWQVGASLITPYALVPLAIFGVECWFDARGGWSRLYGRVQSMSIVPRGWIYATATFALILLAPTHGRPFIYFQF